jgi:hypothetical protein
MRTAALPFSEGAAADRLRETMQEAQESMIASGF